jgi:hypothetical protein
MTQKVDPTTAPMTQPVFSSVHETLIGKISKVATTMKNEYAKGSFILKVFCDAILSDSANTKEAISKQVDNLTIGDVKNRLVKYTGTQRHQLPDDEEEVKRLFVDYLMSL